MYISRIYCSSIHWSLGLWDKLVIDFVFCLEPQFQEELPERLLGGFQFAYPDPMRLPTREPVPRWCLWRVWSFNYHVMSISLVVSKLMWVNVFKFVKIIKSGGISDIESDFGTRWSVSKSFLYQQNFYQVKIFGSFKFVSNFWKSQFFERQKNLVEYKSSLTADRYIPNKIRVLYNSFSVWDSLVIDLSFVLESQFSDELPERLMAGFQLCYPNPERLPMRAAHWDAMKYYYFFGRRNTDFWNDSSHLWIRLKLSFLYGNAIFSRFFFWLLAILAQVQQSACTIACHLVNVTIITKNGNSTIISIFRLWPVKRST